MSSNKHSSQPPRFEVPPNALSRIPGMDVNYHPSPLSSGGSMKGSNYVPSPPPPASNTAYWSLDAQATSYTSSPTSSSKDSRSSKSSSHRPSPPSSSVSSVSSRDSRGSNTPEVLLPKRDRIPQFTNYAKGSDSRLAPARTKKAIYFDWFGVPHGYGVSMMDLGARSIGAIADDMVGGYDQDLAGLGLKTLNFRIAWPGYPVEWIRPIPVVTDYGTLYRADLAAHIASQFSRYCEKAEYENIAPSEAQWRISIKGIQFRHIHLVSIVNLYGDVWQADITVPLPHQR